jgi:catechol 2,3-dioxygenase-like lactoylglutathione lyase family enzyme
MAVPARISLITLGVADVDRATAFYERLGWERSPASVPGAVSFFRTAGSILALWGRTDLATDAGVPDPGAAGFSGVAHSINLEDANAVDAALADAVAAGATLLKSGTRADWGGYSGYFSDLDGHVWEIAHNPGWPLGPEGLPTLP